jgi:hypothetical protein
MHFFVTSRIHVNNTPDIARQPPVTRIEKPLAAMFSVGSASRLYSEDPRPAEASESEPRVEAGSNTPCES